MLSVLLFTSVSVFLLLCKNEIQILVKNRHWPYSASSFQAIMATAQKFCLKWNNFQSNVTSVFDNLRQDEELVDITLCCEGQKIKAHRVMLSACSPYFRDLLKVCYHCSMLPWCAKCGSSFVKESQIPQILR